MSRSAQLLERSLCCPVSESCARSDTTTVTRVSQASFKSPLLMVASRKDGNRFQPVIESRTAALHVLDSGRRDVAQKVFVATTESQVLLNGEPYIEGTNGAPVLERLGAYLECKTLEIIVTHGDHAVVIFEALDAVLRREIEPLTVMGSPWQYGG
jgi:flavin reductase (DIM6/NTAB) family NADH-FMN oxidoreductase RutF